MGRPLVISVVAVAVALAAACSGEDPEDRIKKASLSEGCLINSDCADPMVCAFRRCHEQCKSSKDCPIGQRCIISESPAYVCQLEDERDCTHNSQCPYPQICAVDLECRNECFADSDCIKGQVCAVNTCADPDELDKDGNLPNKLYLDGGGPMPCTYSSQCAPPNKCIAGLCRLECKTNVDCPAGQTCEAGTCTLPTPTPTDGGDAGPTPCVYNSECITLDPAFVCLGGICRYECLGNADCPAGTSCGNNKCLVDADASLDGGVDGSDASADGGGSADTGPSCKYNSDCTSYGPGFICSFGSCVPQCKADIDCLSGQKCQSGQCVWVAPDGAPDAYFKACNLNSDCPAPLKCGAGGQCVYECVVASDCATSGACCIQNLCVTGQLCKTWDAGSPDSGTDGGSGDGGTCSKPCMDNLACDDGVFCNGVESCKAGCCGPALDTPCNSHSSCIEDYCTEATKSCSHKVLADQDFDGDGQLSIGCTNGEDCNDKDPTVYKGAKELCDGQDNDCNGKVDDKSRQPFGPTFAMNTPAAANNSWTSGSGAPLGSDWVMFFGDGSGLAYESGDLYAQKFDTAGNAIGTPSKLKLFGPSNVMVLDASGGPTSAAVVYDKIAGTSRTRYLTTVGTDLTVGGHVALFPTSTVATGDADLTWTGTQHVVGYVHASGGSNYGSLAAFKPDGTSAFGATPVPTTDGSGKVYASRIRVAWSGSTIAAAYSDYADGSIRLSIFSSGGAVLSGPILIKSTLATLQLLGVGGTAGGYVVLWSGSSNPAVQATFVATDGTAGATVSLPNTKIPTNGFGDTDGLGAMFALEYSDGIYLGYGRGALADPFELALAIVPSSTAATDFATIAANGVVGAGQRAGIFFWSDGANRPYGKAVGCAP